MRMLVVDDSSTLRKMVAMIVGRLPGAPVELLEASTGAEALEIVGREGATLDLMLCDPGIPDTDGLSVLKKVKSNAALAHIAVVVMTGDMSGATVEKARQLGAEGFLQKPFRKAELVDLIESVRGRPPRS
jgi:two-component system chemotaxis response regulator CheY